MTLLQPICAILNRWIDETSRAEDAAGYHYRDRKEAVRKVGRIHYAIWLEDLHKGKPITLGNCLWCVCTYSAGILRDLMFAPFNIILCERS